jgi:cell division protein FtsQ
VARSSAPPRRASDDEPTVRLAHRQFARRQWARRWLAWRRLLVLLVVVGVAAAGGWLVFFSSLLAVERVQVSGTEVLQPGQVRRVAAVPTGEPLASVALDSIAARVESLAPVAAVDVSRAWPDQVHIDVTEREAVAVVERAGTVQGVDAEGVLFRTFDDVPERLPLVRISAATRSEALAGATEVIAALPDDLARRVDHLTVRTMDSISLQLRNGRTVFWGSAAQSANKAEVLAVLLRQKASIYDVSVPGRPTIER